VSKTIEAILAVHGGKVRDWYRDSDGYWFNLKAGWQASPHSEVHSVHEWKVSDLKRSFRAVCPCSCEQCGGKS
jgi:hypothetical protein